MEDEMEEQADKLLTMEQHTRGPVPKPWTALRISDSLTILGLTVLGTMLIIGAVHSVAAVAAAVMLFSFYMAMPPFPGLPAAPGPEHSLFVNKNLIEVFALLAIAALPSGKWFGLDGVLSVFFSNWRSDKKLKSGLSSTVSVGDEPEPEATPA